MLKYLEMPASLVWHSRSYEEYMDNDSDGLNFTLDKIMGEAYYLYQNSPEEAGGTDYVFDAAYRLAVCIYNQRKPHVYITNDGILDFVGRIFPNLWDTQHVVIIIAYSILAAQRALPEEVSWLVNDLESLVINDFRKTAELKAELMHTTGYGSSKDYSTELEKAEEYLKQIRGSLDTDLRPQPADFANESFYREECDWLEKLKPKDLPAVLRLFRSKQQQKSFLEQINSYRGVQPWPEMTAKLLGNDEEYRTWIKRVEAGEFMPGTGQAGAKLPDVPDSVADKDAMERFRAACQRQIDILSQELEAVKARQKAKDAITTSVNAINAANTLVSDVDETLHNRVNELQTENNELHKKYNDDTAALAQARDDARTLLKDALAENKQLKEMLDSGGNMATDTGGGNSDMASEGMPTYSPKPSTAVTDVLDYQIGLASDIDKFKDDTAAEKAAGLLRQTILNFKSSINDPETVFKYLEEIESISDKRGEAKQKKEQEKQKTSIYVKKLFNNPRNVVTDSNIKALNTGKKPNKSKSRRRNDRSKD